MIEKIISILAPHHCFGCQREGNLLCLGCRETSLNDNKLHCYMCNNPTFDRGLCQNCRLRSPFLELFVVGAYSELVEKLIYAYKFKRTKAASEPLAELLDSALPYISNPVIVPIPTASSRIRQRGYDQVLLLARKLGKKRQLSLLTVLERTNQGRQLGASRTQRLRQAKDTFRIMKPELVEGKTIILLDDVLTTGATLENAAIKLKQAGAAQIYGLVVAQQQLD